MNTGALLQLLAGLGVLAAGVWLYRKRVHNDPDGPRRYGSQAGTFVIVIGLLLALYAFGRMGMVW